MKKTTYQLLGLHALIFIFSINQVLGQDISDVNPSLNIKQGGLVHKFRLGDYSHKQKKNYNKQKTYYWYKAQRLIATQGGSSGLLLNGIYQSFYKDKQLFEKGNFKNGLKDGLWKKWYGDGQLKNVERWRNGRQVRRQDFYDENGQIQKRVWVSRLKKEIRSIDCTIVIRGNRKRIIKFDSEGNRMNVTKYKNDVLHGNQKIINKNRTRIKSRYQNGKLIEVSEKSEGRADQDKSKKVKESQEKE